MEYLLFISRDVDRPWAIYIPFTNEFLTASEIRIRCHSETLNNATNYVIHKYRHTSFKIHEIAPKYVVRVVGRLRWLDGAVAEIVPEFKMI